MTIPNRFTVHYALGGGAGVAGFGLMFERWNIGVGMMVLGFIIVVTAPAMKTADENGDDRRLINRSLVDRSLVMVVAWVIAQAAKGYGLRGVLVEIFAIVGLACIWAAAVATWALTRWEDRQR